MILSIIIIFYAFNIIIKKKLEQTGIELRKANYDIEKLIFESLQILKIVILHKVSGFFLKDLKNIHYRQIKYNSYSHSLSQIPKIILETLLISFIIIFSLIIYIITTVLALFQLYLFRNIWLQNFSINFSYLFVLHTNEIKYK